MLEGESNIRSIKRCNVCIQNYNLQNKKPLFVCHNHHTICKQCYDNMPQKKCPFCRNSIEKPIQNGYIQQLIGNTEDSCCKKFYDKFDCVCFLKCTLKCKNQITNNNSQMASAFTVIIYGVQFPFLLLDLVFGINGSANQSIDQSTLIITVRHWFLFMGLFRLSCVILLISFIFLRLFSAISIQQFNRYESFVIIAWIYMQSSWMIISVILFIFAISKQYNGGIFAYGLILTIIHIFTIIFILSYLVYIRLLQRKFFRN